MPRWFVIGLADVRQGYPRNEFCRLVNHAIMCVDGYLFGQTRKAVRWGFNRWRNGELMRVGSDKIMCSWIDIIIHYDDS